MGDLYIVATPIGNLKDFSFRAMETLKLVDLILCEDTRITRRLLDKYEIKKPCLSYHRHSKITKIKEIIDNLKQGKNLALVSDAGTPGISDPGNYLIQKIIEDNPGINIIPIPGPSAITAVLSATAIKNDRFLFLGFLPHKKGRQTLIKEIKESKYTVVLYESKHRILKLLNELDNALEDTKKKVEVYREITKIHESIYREDIKKIIETLKNRPEEQKGEFAVVIG